MLDPATNAGAGDAANDDEIPSPSHLATQGDTVLNHNNIDFNNLPFDLGNLPAELGSGEANDVDPSGIPNLDTRGETEGDFEMEWQRNLGTSLDIMQKELSTLSDHLDVTATYTNNATDLPNSANHPDFNNQVRNTSAKCNLNGIIEDGAINLLSFLTSNGDESIDFNALATDQQMGNEPLSHDPTSADSPRLFAADHPWNLRPRPKEHLGWFATWVDQDESGDYDPNATEPVRPPPKPRTIGLPRQTGGEDGPSKKRISTMEALRRSGNRFCITLKIGPEKAAEYHQKYQDNWPDDWLINNIDIEYVAEDSSSDPGNYKLRHRDTLDNDTDEDLTGRPEGRGCRNCRVTGTECSMRDPYGVYPCDSCMHSKDEDCEPLIEPLQKQPCETCRRHYRACSYAYPGSDHRQPCSFCTEKGWKCVAGPLPDPQRVRLNDDGDPAIPTPRGPRYTTGKYRSCTQCRSEEKQCPLLRTKDEPPCLCCKQANRPCTFEPTPPKPKPNAPATTVKHRAPLRHADPKDPPNVIPTGNIRDITTALSHPITFSCPPDDEKRPCSWCCNANPFYALYGHVGGRRTVRVIEWRDQRGCTELKNGYAQQDGKEPSRMCVHCLLPRIKMMFCQGHVFRRMQGVGEEAMAPRDKQPRAALRRLMNVGRAAAKQDIITRGNLCRKELLRWCAICPNIATDECCAGGTMGDLGCGLKLCRTCRGFVAAEKGRFVRFVEELERKIERTEDFAMRVYPMGLRADYDFFKFRSYMMRQVREIYNDVIKLKK